ncbi:MAG: hypothetical protein IJ130_02365 [Solobacterium sp.]|nr:hypothetical protein [Solobacterium sp.]
MAIYEKVCSGTRGKETHGQSADAVICEHFMQIIRMHFSGVSVKKRSEFCEDFLFLGIECLFFHKPPPQSAAVIVGGFLNSFHQLFIHTFILTENLRKLNKISEILLY